MHLDQSASDSQAETSAAPPHAQVTRLRVFFEDGGLFVGCDAGPGIGDRHRRPGRAVACYLDFDVARLGEFDSVADHVGNDLPDPPGVRPSRGVDSRQAQLDPLELSADLFLADHALSDVVDIDVGSRQAELPRLERGQVENIVDERRQVTTASSNDLQTFPRRIGQGPVHFGQQHLGKAEDGIEWRSELVAQCGQKCAAVSVVSQRSRQVLSVAALGLGIASDQFVESTRELTDRVNRSDRDRLACWFRLLFGHGADASAHEIDVRIDVARQRGCHQRRNADQQSYQDGEGGEQGPHGGWRILGRLEDDEAGRFASRLHRMNRVAHSAELSVSGSRSSTEQIEDSRARRGPKRRIDHHIAARIGQEQLDTGAPRRTFKHQRPLIGRYRAQAFGQRQPQDLGGLHGVRVAAPTKLVHS